MRVLVTGGGGLVGRPLLRRLAERHEALGVDVDEVDVTDAAAVNAVFEAFRPEHVMHLAAWTDVDGCELDPERALAVNAGAARTVAAACAERGVPMLYVSTDYVFDGTKDGTYDEGDPVAPLSEYGRSKLAGEDHVRELAPEWRIVRCQSIYGHGKKSFVDAILARARAGGALSVVTDQRVSPSYAEDVAEALLAVLERAPPGLYHASNAGSCTWYECAREVLDLSGLATVEIGSTTAAAFGRPAPRPANSAFDCSKLIEATGHTPRTWQAALADYLAQAQTAVVGEEVER